MPGTILGMWGDLQGTCTRDAYSGEIEGLNGVMWLIQGSHLNNKIRLRWLWGAWGKGLGSMLVPS